MSDAPEIPWQTDWDRLGQATYVAFWEAANMDVEAWSQLCDESRECWRVAAKHALQMWLHCDFRETLQDAEVIRNVAHMLAVSKGEPAAQRLATCVALVPLLLIDGKVLDGTSAEIFPPMEDDQ